MQKTILFTVILSVLFIIGCTKSTDKIFNGKDLSNWNFVVENDAVPADQVYTVQEGLIIVKGEPLGYMYTQQKYSDFMLELEYRWGGEASNSGVFFLIEEPSNPFPKGIECQLKADKAGDFVLLSGADLKEYVLPEGVTERPKFPVIEKRESSSEKPVGEWNKVKIRVKGGAIEIYINDVLQNSATSEVKEGHIGLQSEGKEIQFRNIILEKL
ncbi:MAG: DUF1080 domain-containing protein [Proteiniphilum sp.]|jgi:hypothetical protein|nr:DUF1080 domain-containing protein [Proteiniphilum sp.]